MQFGLMPRLLCLQKNVFVICGRKEMVESEVCIGEASKRRLTTTELYLLFFLLNF